MFAAHEAGNQAEVMFPYYSELQLLRLEISNSLSDSHSIKEHARSLKVSESYFQHLYKNTLVFLFVMI